MSERKSQYVQIIFVYINKNVWVYVFVLFLEYDLQQIWMSVDLLKLSLDVTHLPH